MGNKNPKLKLLMMILVLAAVLPLWAAYPTPVDMYSDLLGGNVGDQITNAIAVSSSHSSLSGTWAVAPATLTHFAVSNLHGCTMNGPVSVSAVTYPANTGAGRSWDFDLSTNTTQFANYGLGTTKSIVSYGMCIWTDVAPSASPTNYDLMSITGVSGAGSTSGICQFRNGIGAGSNGYQFRAHGSWPGNSPVGAQIPVSQSHLYYCSLQVDLTTGAEGIYLYDAETTPYTLVGTSSTALPSGTSMNPTFQIGVNAHSIASANHVYFSNILFDTTNGSQPLLPEADGPPTPGNGGVITTASITPTTLTLNWTKATDTVTPQASLQYEVCQSTSNNVTSVAQCEAASIIQAFTPDIATFNVTSLAPLQAYYWNVVVKDGVGNKAAYVPVTSTQPCGATKIVFTSQPLSALLGASLGSVVVKVENSSSTVCTDSSASIVLSKDSGATWGTLNSSSSLTKSATAGIATWTDLFITVSNGSGSIDAASSGLTGAVSTSFNITSPGGVGAGRLILR